MRRVALFSALIVAVTASVGGLHWSNWDARQTCQPQEFVMPADEGEVVSHVNRAAKLGLKLKVVGAGHSFSPIALTDGIMMNLDRMSDIIDVQRHVQGTNYSHVTVGAGIRLRDLNDKLEDLSLALENMGATAAQSIAGATATGTHGTGTLLGSISTQIVGMRIVTAAGEIVDVDANTPGNMLDAARVNVGVLGVVVRVTLRVVDAFRMRLELIPWDLDVLMFNLPNLLKKNPRLQWYWTPYTGNATVVVRTPTDDAITGCWATHEHSIEDTVRNNHAKGNYEYSSCVDVSYKTLTDSRESYARRALYTEMEMFVPIANAKQAVAEFRQFQESALPRHKSDVSLFTGVRYVQSDNIWLSPQYGRDNAVISMIVSGDQKVTGSPDEFSMYAHGLEAISAPKLDGRPHWGKMNYANATDFEAAYPKWADFKALRAKLDPTGMFLNSYMQNIFE